MTDKTRTGWTTVAFGDIAEPVNDRVDAPETAGVNRYVGLEHLDAGSLTIRRWGSPEDVSSTKLRFGPGDIIFGRRRVYQRKLAVADFHGICSAHALVLRAKPDAVLPEFLPYFMQSDYFMEAALKISVGSLSPTINWKTLAKYEFELPSLEEQRRITMALGAADRAVDSLRALLEATLELRLSMVCHYEDGLESSRLTTLGAVTEGLQSGRSPSSVGREMTEDEYGVLKVSAVGDWEFVPSENKVVLDDQFDRELEDKSGDFLVTRANADPDSVGRTCIVGDTPTHLMLSDKTWRLSFSDDHLYDPTAVLAWTKSRSFRRHVLNQLNGTDAKNISQARFLAGPLPILDGEFETFGARVHEVTDCVEQLAQRAQEAGEIKRLLLSEILSQ